VVFYSVLKRVILLVTNSEKLIKSTKYQVISEEESKEIISTWKHIQYDSETTGRDARINTLLCAQFGYKETNTQIVVDTTTVPIEGYKELLEGKLLIGQNLKFDLQFLFNHNIIPRIVYDTMIVEQLLHLGWKRGTISYSLHAIADRRLHIDIDKTVRGEIIWRGLDDTVILYAAGDVMYLEDIAASQIKDLKKEGLIKGALIENNFTPVIAYLEWCGIKLDETKWKQKMERDRNNLELSKKLLDEFVVKCGNPAFYEVDPQGDLFTNSFDLTPHSIIDWNSSPQLIKFAKFLGFNTTIKDKQTGEDKESALEKQLSCQKGVNDEFLNLLYGWNEIAPDGEEIHHWGFKEVSKVCSTYGQGHLDAINPKTGRLHTIYRAIGTLSGRMSSGSRQSNTDLARYKKIPESACTYPNMQQLPHDAFTRSCFIAEEGNLFCSCDYSAMEARIGAEVYNEKVLLDEFLYGSGDTHAAYAKAVFAKELEGIDTKDIKTKRPDLRSKVKPIEFAMQFGSDGTAVAPQLRIPVEEARQLVSNLLSGMKGLAEFKKRGSRFVRNNGYVVVLPQTGHKIYWQNWSNWKLEEQSYTPEFWEIYKLYHKGTDDDVAQQVKHHMKEGSKWDRLALNGPTQGGGAVVLKEAATTLFNWIVDNGYFGKILLVNFTHDEINSEFPEELKDTYPKLVADIMEQTAAKYYHKLPIPAEASVGKYWIH